MDIYQTQELFNSMYAGKKVTYEFDEKCHRQYEVIMTDGKANTHHHVECDKVKVAIEGLDPVYVPILPHRMTISWEDMKPLVESRQKIQVVQDETIAIAQ